MAGKPKDLTGQKFGRLLAIRLSETLNNKVAWLWRCDCGAEKEIRAGDVVSGKTRSCGCFRSEALRERPNGVQHGHASRIRGKSKEYSSWESMRKRCSPTAPYDVKRRYFDKGITVCDRWQDSFEAFIEDMGLRPDNTEGIRWSLDRIDNSKGYYKENCRWATQFQQVHNRNLTCRTNTGESNISLKVVKGIEHYCVALCHMGFRYGRLFSCRKYGKDTAIKLAIDWRNELTLKLGVESNAKTN